MLLLSFLWGRHRLAPQMHSKENTPRKEGRKGAPRRVGDLRQADGCVCTGTERGNSQQEQLEVCPGHGGQGGHAEVKVGTQRSRWARGGQGGHAEVKVSANTEARHGVAQTPSSGASNHADRSLSVSPCCHPVTCYSGALTGWAYPTPSPKGRTRSPPCQRMELVGNSRASGSWACALMA